MLNDLIIIIYSWIFFSAWQLLSFPIVFRLVGKRLYDAGWGIARATSWLIIGLPIWFLAHLGFPINTKIGLWLIIFLIATLAFKLFRQQQQQIVSFIQTHKRLIFIQEILFLFGIVFLSLVRGYMPEINGLEKFMDAGLMVSYQKSPTLPIEDMWLSGYNFNYYTFGHFLGAIAGTYLSQPIDISYNIILGFIMGLMLMEVFSVVANLSAGSVKKPLTRGLIFAGIIGAFITTVGGNSQSAWFFLKNHTFTGYWYPDATRFIPETIHEFPAYSFIVSDLHAHVWSMVLVLLHLILLYIWSKELLTGEKTLHNHKPLIYSSVAVGVMMGILASTSTWDAFIYSIFLSIFGVLALLWKKQLLPALVLSAVLMMVSAVITASPWLLNFTSISEGVAIADEHSEFWRLVALWLGHVVVAGLASVVALSIFKKKQTHQIQLNSIFILTITVTALTLIILPELIYFKDIYETQPRANTMFKLTFQGFILFNIAIGWLAGVVKQRILPPATQLPAMIAIVFLLITVGGYSYFGYRDYYGGLKTYQGLDGLKWLQTQYPDDYHAIDWIRKNIVDRPVILEAVGDSYTTFARVSTFTGLPTVLGWRVHEWLWRGSYDLPGQRSGEVEQMYNQPRLADSQRLMRQYKVKYIFVGKKEYEAYAQLDLEGLKSYGDVIFQRGDTLIIAVK